MEITKIIIVELGNCFAWITTLTDIQIFSSPFKMGDIPSPDNWNPQRSPRNKISTQRSPRNLGGLVERVSIDLEDVPVIEGVRVADDPREANIIYRNARYFPWVVIATWIFFFLLTNLNCQAII